MSDSTSGRKQYRYEEHRPWQDLQTMLTVDEARDRIISTLRQTDAQPVALLDAHGLCLAEDIVSGTSVPPFRNSAMDGYAVRAVDIAGASSDAPVRLRVVEEVPAGRAPEVALEAGEAIRIMTGAVMPEGADTVVRFEETDEFERRVPSIADSGQWHVEIRKSVGEGSNVRHAGEDVSSGDLVLSAGQYLGAAELGVLASVNCTKVKVRVRPQVAILATGDEVVDPGEELLPGQIRNSNNVMLAALVREAGGEPHVLGIANDNAADVRAKIRSISDYDLLLTSGGVSMGDYDVVKDVLQSEGQIDLWQVRIKPGKPMAFGHIAGKPVIGLPGNPVAAYVAFLQFGRPAIRHLMGATQLDSLKIRARLLTEHENRGYRRHFVRGRVEYQDGELVVRPVPVQGSGVLTSVTRANCFFVIPEDRNHAVAGTEVDVLPLVGYD